MKNIFQALFRWIAQVAASEAGECLSVRRKAHLLEAERYRRLAAEAADRPAAALRRADAVRRPVLPARHAHRAG
ncbi:MAG: hypothetical protein N3C63_06405 [Rhodocyclaceae bacterium]|nr:hypothetical protein [Rhodocyclaceae bacterium]